MNDFVPLVDPDDLPPDLRAQYDATSRPGLGLSHASTILATTCSIGSSVEKPSS